MHDLLCLSSLIPLLDEEVCVPHQELHYPEIFLKKLHY